MLKMSLRSELISLVAIMVSLLVLFFGLSVHAEPTSQKTTTPREAQPQKVDSQDPPQVQAKSEPTEIKANKAPSTKSDKRAKRALRRRVRDSALTTQVGRWSMGLFNPLRVQFARDWSAELHPLVALAVAPHAKLWHRWWSHDGITVSGLYGFTTPAWSLQQAPPLGLAGYFAPSCDVLAAEPSRAPESCQRAGVDFAPQLGVRASGLGAASVWTLEADIAAGLMISGDRPAPLDTYTPVEVAYLPSTHLYRAHIGARHSMRVARPLIINVGADLYLSGQADDAVTPERDPLIFSVNASLDWAMTRHLTLTLGAILWSGDQRAFELVEDSEGFVTKESLRSYDLYPTFDLIWRY